MPFWGQKRALEFFSICFAGKHTRKRKPLGKGALRTKFGVEDKSERPSNPFVTRPKENRMFEVVLLSLSNYMLLFKIVQDLVLA